MRTKSYCRRILAFVAAGAIALAVSPASPAAASNDPLFDQQWDLTQIGAEHAWTSSTGAGVRVGIVDTGVDASQPDLVGKIDLQATCIEGPCLEGSAIDGEGHGTAVAGVVAATTGNGIGMAGTAPDAHLVVAKAMDDRGAGTTEDINRGIQWVVDHGARVVNLSLGDANLNLTSLLGTPLQPAIEYAWSRGAIPVLAAGNYESGIATEGSADYGNLDAVVVGSTNKEGGVPGYSTSLGNAKWALVAPGGNGAGAGTDILSTAPGDGYGWKAGTSLAAPHVSGALALLLAEGLAPAAAIQRLLATADRSPACGTGCHGRLRVDAAVESRGGSALATQLPAAPTPVLGKRTETVDHAVASLAVLLVVGMSMAEAVTWRRLHSGHHGTWL